MAISKTSHDGRLLADPRAGAGDSRRRVAADRRRREDRRRRRRRSSTRRIVYESKDERCTLEAQDFYDQRHEDDRDVLRAERPRVGDGHGSGDRRDDELLEGARAPTTRSKGSFPDGQYTCVEGDRQVEHTRRRARVGQHRHLEAEARRHGQGLRASDAFQRLRGGKASNPVVSTDGRFMAFQTARTTTPPASATASCFIGWTNQAADYCRNA